jgi:type I restriction enzyme S subunit
MAGEWKSASLREAGVTLIDCDHRTPPAAESGYPYVAIPQLKEGRLDLADVRRISPEHFADWTRKAKPQQNDVILSRRCNPGETAFVPAGLECALGQNLVLLRADGSKVFPPFLRWLLNGPDWWEQVRTFINVGAIFDSLKCAEIPNFKMRLPPVAEQKAIAAVLGALDDKIELNRRMNATLEAMARALFQSWFVDFDPVRAKLDGRKPTGLDEPTAALFPAAFHESRLGSIPVSWNVTTLADLCSKITDGSHHSPKSVEAGLPMASVKDMSNWEINLSGCRLISPEDFENLVANGCQPESGDLLLAKDGATCLDTTCEYQQPDKVVLLSSVAILRLKNVADAGFLHTWLGLESTKQYLKEGFVSGSAIPRVVLRDMKRAQLVVPSRKILDAFARTVAPLRKQIQRNVVQSRTLATLRDTLLPKLLSGKLVAKP